MCVVAGTHILCQILYLKSILRFLTGCSHLPESGSRNEALIRFSQYIANRECDVPSKNCQMGLIQSVLFNSGNKGLDISEIVQEIDRQMGLKNFPSVVIIGVLNSNKDEDVYLKNGKYFLDSGTLELLNKTISKRKTAMIHFENLVENKVKEITNDAKTSSEKDLPDLAVKTIYELLATWFGTESQSIAESFKILHQLYPPHFPDNLLDEVLSKIDDLDSRQVVRQVIFEMFKDIDSETGELLFEMLQNYLNLQLLNADPECRFLEKIAFSRKTLVLDTNVLMSVFLEADRVHEGIKETISIAKDLGVKLVITKRTEQEWLWSLENANNQYISINKQRPSFLPNLGDIFIRSFFKKKTSDPTLTWNSYYLQLRQIKFMAYEKGISYWYKKEFDVDKLPNKDLFEPLTQWVFNCSNRKGYPKPRPVSEHDAYHLLLIRKLREEVPSDILGPSCWFLTLDSTLLSADEGLNKLMAAPFDPPSSFMADMWVPIISPFLGPEISEKRLSEAFSHLMSTHFATIPANISADMVLETLNKWLPYEKLTNKEIEAILSDSLVIKYYNQLKEARIKDPSRVEELSNIVHQKVDEKVFDAYDLRVDQAEFEKKQAELQKEEAQKAAFITEERLAAEAKQKKRVLDVCLYLGIIFALVGLVVLIVINLVTGIALVIPGIAFVILSLGFSHLKIKSGPLQIEANK